MALYAIVHLQALLTFANDVLDIVIIAIDLVLGGLSCCDYLKMKDIDKGNKNEKEGKHLLLFAKLVNKIHNHSKQLGRHCFYLCDNLLLKGQDLTRVEDAFKPFPTMVTMVLDAWDVSPCRRRRMYWVCMWHSFDLSLSKLDMAYITMKPYSAS